MFVAFRARQSRRCDYDGPASHNQLLHLAVRPRYATRRFSQRTGNRALVTRCFSEEEQSVSKAVEENVAKAKVKVSHTMTGVLSDASTQATTYWVLGGMSLMTAVTALLLPAQCAGFMFGAAPDRVVQSIIRAAAATLLTTTVVKFTLKEASVRGQLYMDTFQRLNIGLMVQSLISLVVLAQAVSLRNAVLTGFILLECGTGLCVSSRIYSLSKGGVPFPSPSKTLSAAISVLMPRNLPATVYSLLTIVLAGMAALCLGTYPGQQMRLYEGLMGPMTVFMMRIVGGGLLMMTLVAYSLKDGADRQKLGALTFRWLNLGLACSISACFVFMTMDLQAGLLAGNVKTAAMLAAQALAFMWTSYMYIAGTSKPKGPANAASGAP